LGLTVPMGAVRGEGPSRGGATGLRRRGAVNAGGAVGCGGERIGGAGGAVGLCAGERARSRAILLRCARTGGVGGPAVRQRRPQVKGAAAAYSRGHCREGNVTSFSLAVRKLSGVNRIGTQGQ